MKFHAIPSPCCVERCANEWVSAGCPTREENEPTWLIRTGVCLLNSSTKLMASLL